MPLGIETGEYLVRVACPHCGREAEVPCVVEQVLKVKGSEGSLTVALAAKAVPHDCRQEQLPFAEEDGLSPAQEMLRYGAGVSAGPDAVFEAVDPSTGEIREVTSITGRGVRL